MSTEIKDVKKQQEEQHKANLMKRTDAEQYNSETAGIRTFGKIEILDKTESSPTHPENDVFNKTHPLNKTANGASDSKKHSKKIDRDGNEKAFEHQMKLTFSKQLEKQLAAKATNTFRPSPLGK